ncbi:ComF family protein [Alkalibaculum sp. M08DMB]|uniref:ComF family protein n=1 Tax=Alkalibaculum sporogenes TaxID=2655001 RepID=A0A6A7KB07_9FIRM|nr:ComF family protein [Alkalibaculum sporogenes]MPW26377.1 ComF family protein [Alkalibaculum sporogenes]
MMIDKFLDIIFIPNGRCPICKRVIFFSDEFICHQCKSSLDMVGDEKCKKCGKEIDDGKNYCSGCITYNYNYQEGFALYNYEGSIKTIIHNIKFSNCPELAVYMGKVLGKSMKNCSWLEELDYIIPIPLHENRFKTRGYNQSEKISNGIINEFTQMDKALDIKLCINTLIRQKDTPHQLKLSKEERFSNVKNAFKVTNKDVINEKTILLVDDVYTTGATIDECSAKLLDNGALKVYFAVLASGKTNQL